METFTQERTHKHNAHRFGRVVGVPQLRRCGYRWRFAV